jgi:hypothetical protein
MLTRLLCLTAALFVLAAPMQRPPAGRVVAVGDVHGNLEGLKALLQQAGMINPEGRWSGGRATLVQSGDIVDRGPQSRAALDFLMTLQKDAESRGGSVRISLGNHEVMVLFGDMRYVVTDDYAAFADGRSEERRQAAFREYTRIQKKGAPMDVAAWMRSHPPGFIEHREAFGPQGKYGKWLRSLPAVMRVGDTLFVHGGLNPAVKFRNVNQVNEAVAEEIRAFDTVTRFMVDHQMALPFFTLEEYVVAAAAEVERLKAKGPDQTPVDNAHLELLEGLTKIGTWLSMHNDGPLWFRGYDRWPDAEGEALINPLLQMLGARRVVVGHTIQPNAEIRSRFGGKVILIDTGIARGRLSALEIDGGRVRALYTERVVDLN